MMPLFPHGHGAETYRKMADGGHAVLSYEEARKEEPSLAETWVQGKA